jgi:hypothetical protein
MAMYTKLSAGWIFMGAAGGNINVSSGGAKSFGSLHLTLVNINTRIMNISPDITIVFFITRLNFLNFIYALHQSIWFIFLASSDEGVFISSVLKIENLTSKVI